MHFLPSIRRRSAAWAVSCLVAMAALASPCVAHAQTSDRASAEALFRAGRQAMDRGDFEQACLRFTESNRLDPALGTVFNLGACHEKLGHFAEAWQFFREVADRAPAGDERAAIAKARADAVEPNLSRLTITLAAGAPPGTVIVKDGVELGAGGLGVELPANPGEHVLVVRTPGRADREVRITLARGMRREVTLEPGLAVAEPQKTTPAEGPAPGGGMEPAGERGSSKTLAYVAIGVGAVGLVASVLAGAGVLAKKGVVADHCDGKTCDQEGIDAARAGKTYGTIGTISFAVGAVALGGGIVLLTTSGSPERSGTQARLADGFVASFGGRF